MRPTAGTRRQSGTSRTFTTSCKETPWPTSCRPPPATIPPEGPRAVETIIARYWLDQEFNVGVGFNRDTGQPYLFCFGYVWPEAWKVPEGVSPADFYPFEDEVYEDGADGFTQLLQELAPHLAEPLTVQAVGSIKCQFPLSATEWHIEPNGTDVEINEFQHSDPEPVAALEKVHV